jgi:hypothetical protein
MEECFYQTIKHKSKQKSLTIQLFIVEWQHFSRQKL